MKNLRSDRVKRLRNTSCAFCGTGENLTKEHVIGRNFVPKGKIRNQFNLILNVCSLCNNHKSKLEDDISSITMQANAFNQYVNVDPDLVMEAERKSRSKSRRTNKKVSDSKEVYEISKSLTGLNLSFKLQGPAQIDNERIYELSYFHIRYYFYLITFNKEYNTGYVWPGKFYPLFTSSKGDSDD